MNFYKVQYKGKEERFKFFRYTVEANSEIEALARVFKKVLGIDISTKDGYNIACPDRASINIDGDYFFAEKTNVLIDVCWDSRESYSYLPHSG